MRGEDRTEHDFVVLTVPFPKAAQVSVQPAFPKC